MGNGCEESSRNVNPSLLYIKHDKAERTTNGQGPLGAKLELSVLQLHFKIQGQNGRWDA